MVWGIQKHNPENNQTMFACTNMMTAGYGRTVEDKSFVDILSCGIWLTIGSTIMGRKCFVFHTQVGSWCLPRQSHHDRLCHIFHRDRCGPPTHPPHGRHMGLARRIWGILPGRGRVGAGRSFALLQPILKS
jgi:hypothetical protein